MISYDTIWYLLHVIVFIENLIILSKCKYLSKSKICLIHKLHRLCMQSKFILVNLIANEKHESQYSYSLCIRTEVWHFVFSFDNLIMLIYTQFLSKWLEYWNSTTYISSRKQDIFAMFFLFQCYVPVHVGSLKKFIDQCSLTESKWIHEHDSLYKTKKQHLRHTYTILV